MDPPEEVRQLLSELVGMAPGKGCLARSLVAWAVLGRALAAVHGEPVPAETEPATQMVLPGVEWRQPTDRHGRTAK